MKVKASDLTVGQTIKIGGKEYTVDRVDTVVVPVTENVSGVLLTYSEDDDGKDPAIHRTHLRSSQKVEVVPPTAMDRMRKGLRDFASNLWSKN